MSTHTYPPATKPRRRWPWALAALIVGLILGSVAGGAAGSTPAPVAAPSAGIVTTTPPSSLDVDVNPPSPTASFQTAPAPAPAKPAGPLTTFGNGTFEVGTDVAAGSYRSPAPETGAMSLCYWDTKNSAGTIQDQGVANEGPSRAKLTKGLEFTSSGCQDWVKTG